MTLFQNSSKSIRILHIDDDESQLSMMRELMKIYDSDIHLDSLSDPSLVLDILSERWYDCLVTDFQMPHMNGIELSRKVRVENNIPIILYTGKGSEEVAEQAFSIGINDYIRKELAPEHYQIIAKRIREVVDKQRMEQIYNSIIKEAVDSIVLVVREKIVFANQSFVELMNAYKEKDVMGIELSKLLRSGGRAIQNDLKKLLQGEKDYFITELEIEKKDGKKTTVEIYINATNYRGEKALICFFRDVTERITLQKEIKNSEGRYRTLLELAPDGILTINLKGDVTYINSAYTLLTGFTKEDIIGKKVWSIEATRPQDVKMFFGLFFDFLRGKEINPIEFQWVNKDGKLGWGEGRASLVKSDNKTREVFLITRDITERKKLEEDLLIYSKEMEQLAEDRAKKLVDSEKMIAAGRVASTVAHDLRGPLSTIKNAVYIMKMNPEKGKELIEIINKALDNAVQMLNEMSEKTIGNKLTKEDTELSVFIESILNETPIPPHIKVKTDLKHSTLFIDRLKIRRVLENLIRNSVEAMPRGGILEISNQIERDKISIKIEDNGIGIPDNVIKNLFQPFHTTKIKGTGLGLYYCKKTIEAHNGEITVKSRIGKGTKFTLSIPKNNSEETNTNEINLTQTNEQNLILENIQSYD